MTIKFPHIRLILYCILINNQKFASSFCSCEPVTTIIMHKWLTKSKMKRKKTTKTLNALLLPFVLHIHYLQCTHNKVKLIIITYESINKKKIDKNYTKLYIFSHGIYTRPVNQSASMEKQRRRQQHQHQNHV